MAGPDFSSLECELTDKEGEMDRMSHAVVDWSWRYQYALIFSLKHMQMVTYRKFYRHVYIHRQSFPHRSVGKESACSAGGPGSIPGSGRSPAEGISYPLQYSWASLVAQLVKESTCSVGDLGSIPGWEDPLEKGTATHSSILAWRSPWTVQSMALQSRTRLSHFTHTQISTHTFPCSFS